MKKYVVGSLALLMLLSVVLAGCSGEKKSSEPASTGNESQSPDFIANRTITGKYYQAGKAFPADQANTKAAKKIREVTGITNVWEPMKTQDLLQELTLTLASGELPDVIAIYWEGTHTATGAAVMSLLAKAAKEGMFYDMKPFLEQTTSKYNRLLDPEYLSLDLKDNVIMRPDFNGAVYMVQTGLPRENVPSSVWIGGTGLYMRSDVAASLGVDLSTIKTHEDVYNLAKKIKDGDFKDGNGKKIMPIGPSIWGGSNRSAYYQNNDFGNNSNFDIDTDGKIKHTVMTDYPMKSVEFIQKLMAEGLMDKESLTMPASKATEAFANASYGMMVMHAFSQSWDGGSDILWAKNKEKLFLPIGPLNNHNGSSEKAVVRRGNTLILIPKKTKNPEEILKFMEWSSTREAELLVAGTEGEDYNLVDRTSKEYLKYTKPNADDDGKDIVMSDKLSQAIKDDPKLNDTLGLTQVFTSNTLFDSYTDLAASFGQGDPDKTKYDYGRKVLQLAAPEVKIVDGLPVGGLLEGFDGYKILKPVLDAYNDAFVKACFAKNLDEANKILEGYKKQLMDAGLEKALQYLQGIEEKKPGSILFYTTS